MGDLLAHIYQAHHNEHCASFLIGNKPEYRDWAITATFYSAVHLVEACFTTESSIQHTETASDRGKGEEKHSYRARKVRELAKPAYQDYRKLMEASQDVRYLSSQHPLATTSADYYSHDTVKDMVESVLPRIRQQLQIAFKAKLD